MRTLPYAQELSPRAGPVSRLKVDARSRPQSALPLHRVSVRELFCRPELCSIGPVLQGLRLGQPDSPRQRMLGRLSQKMLSAFSYASLVLPSALPLSASCVRSEKAQLLHA